MPFSLAHRLLLGRRHLDRCLSRFTGGRKAWIDEIVVVSSCTVASRHYPIEDGSCPLFFSGLIGLHEKLGLTLPPTPNYVFFNLFWHLPSFTTFNPSHMALSRIRMPSFTLVLTSGWHSLNGYPTAIKFDPCASYTILPIMIEHLLVSNPLFLCGNHDTNLYVL